VHAPKRPPQKMFDGRAPVDDLPFSRRMAGFKTEKLSLHNVTATLVGDLGRSGRRPDARRQASKSETAIRRAPG